jgi:hypothetical protein
VQNITIVKQVGTGAMEAKTLEAKLFGREGNSLKNVAMPLMMKHHQMDMAPTLSHTAKIIEVSSQFSTENIF